MKLVDMHCDTLMKLLADERLSLKDGPFDINLDRLKTADSMVQFFACFTNFEDYENAEKANYDVAYETVLKMIARLEGEIAKNPKEIALARNYEEIMQNEKNNKMSAFLTVEEGGVLNGDMSRLDALYQKGVRLITLTWNYENTLAFPNSTDPVIMGKGLKDFGIEVVQKMNDLGMIVDVSHLSDGGFWDVIKYSRSPIVASHSCVRELCGQSRNMTKEMLKALGENGGVVGLNFHGGFLKEDGKASVEDMAAHFHYIADYAGMDAVALGSDFDGGIFGNELEHMGMMPRLYEALRNKHFSEAQIEQIFYKNALRVIKETAK